MNIESKQIIAAILATVATASLTVIDLRPDVSADVPERPAPVVDTISPDAGVGRLSIIEAEAPDTEPVETETPETEPAEPDTMDLGTFKLTAYCPCSACCGEWADGITYTGTTATQGRTIAVDPDVIPLGSSVEIGGQTYIAEDIGGAIQGNRIDVYFRSHAEALQFGVQYATVLLNKTN